MTLQSHAIRLLTLFALTLPFSASAASDKDKTEHPPIQLKNTEQHQLHSDITGRNYLLYIGYPSSYNPKSSRKYPVLYLTDAYWTFIKVNALGPSLCSDHVAKEYIVVGIGYQGEDLDYGLERMYELTPSKVDIDWGHNKEGRTGGAHKFLKAIKKEIIPYVEANMPADPNFRILAGASLGGLFSLYAMYEEPGLFQGIIAISPAVGWDGMWLRNREAVLRKEAAGKSGTDALRLSTRLFMSVGDHETADFCNNIVKFHGIINSGAYADFAYKFRIIDGERHGGTKAEGFNRGIRFMFEKPAEAAQ